MRLYEAHLLTPNLGQRIAVACRRLLRSPLNLRHQTHFGFVRFGIADIHLQPFRVLLRHRSSFRLRLRKPHSRTRSLRPLIRLS